MAETTTHNTDMTRQEVAAFLRSIASGLDSGQETMAIPVGNKEVHLSPPETIDTDVMVSERSRRLRKDVEEVTLEFKWNPTKAAEQSESESRSEPRTESGPETGTESEPGKNR